MGDKYQFIWIFLFDSLCMLSSLPSFHLEVLVGNSCVSPFCLKEDIILSVLEIGYVVYLVRGTQSVDFKPAS